MVIGNTLSNISKEEIFHNVLKNIENLLINKKELKRNGQLKKIEFFQNLMQNLEENGLR